MAKYSQKNFHELILDCCDSESLKMLCEELEEFFINWKNRIPHKSLSLIINTGHRNDIAVNEEIGENIKMIIEKLNTDY